MTAYNVICGGATATGAFQAVGDTGTVGQILLSQGAGAYPIWDDLPAGERLNSANITNEDQVFGDLCYIDGDGEAHIADASSLATAKVFGMQYFSSIGAGEIGSYVLFGLITGIWTWTNIGGYIYLSTVGTSGNTLTETAPSGYGEVVCPVGIIRSATSIWFIPNIEPYVIGSELTYEEITDATKTIVPQKEYGANRAGGVAFTLPAAAAIGTKIKITGIQGNWSIAQNAGQTIYIGSTNTTTGAGGSLTATNAGDCIEMTCITADTNWRATSAWGSITVV